MAAADCILPGPALNIMENAGTELGSQEDEEESDSEDDGYEAIKLEIASFEEGFQRLLTTIRSRLAQDRRELRQKKTQVERQVIFLEEQKRETLQAQQGSSRHGEQSSATSDLQHPMLQPHQEHDDTCPWVRAEEAEAAASLQDDKPGLGEKVPDLYAVLGLQEPVGMARRGQDAPSEQHWEAWRAPPLIASLSNFGVPSNMGTQVASEWQPDTPRGTAADLEKPLETSMETSAEVVPVQAPPRLREVGAASTARESEALPSRASASSSERPASWVEDAAAAMVRRIEAGGSKAAPGNSSSARGAKSVWDDPVRSSPAAGAGAGNAEKPEAKPEAVRTTPAGEGAPPAAAEKRNEAVAKAALVYAAQPKASVSAKAKAKSGPHMALPEVQRSLDFVWVGDKGETYELHFYNDAYWVCVRRDNTGEKGFRVRWDKDTTCVLWGQSYFMDIWDLKKQPTKLVWYSFTDSKKVQPRFTWQRRAD